LAQRVSAETITEITSSPGFVPPGKSPTPPSPEEIIQRTRKELDERIVKFTRSLAGNLSEEDRRRATESLEKARFQRKQFDQLLNEVPEGFKLVPVYYSKITQDQNGAVHDEYLSNVRARFLKFIGENHADAARALGVCEYGIERMKMGLDPTDKDGRQYDMNIDHIIERAGSGLWANSKEKDPDQKPEVEDKFRQNHFGNLILIPTKIHDYKNTLNGLQKIGTLQPGEGRWILMMTPERSEQKPAFICPPQTPGSRWDVLSTREKDPSSEIHHADFTVKQAVDRIRELRGNPLIDKALLTIEEIARGYKRDAAQMANDNIKGRRSLSKIFNDVLEHDESAHEASQLLAPALKEVANNIAKSFDGVADNLAGDKGHKLLYNFNRFFCSNALRGLREEAAKLPLPEAKEIVDICATIEADLKVLIPPNAHSEERGGEGKPKSDPRKNFNGQSARKPRNDNAATPQKDGWKKKKKNKSKKKSNDRGNARKGGWRG
jgi:hypothetical protein